jgi:hypothetical protein
MARIPRILLVSVVAVATVVAIGTALLRDSSSGSVTPQPRNWPEVLRQDPALTVVPCPSGAPPRPEADLCIAGMPTFGTSPATADPLQGGFIDPEVVYADLDGDGVAEAVLRVWGSGLASITGFLVYHEERPRPRLLAAVAGYRMSLTQMPFEAGYGRTGSTLVVLQPVYADGEPPCCPSTGEYSAWTLRGDTLTLLDRMRLRLKP